MKSHGTLIVGVACASLLVAGAWARPQTVFDEGFQLLAAPTEGDAPGTIFRLDSRHRRFEVGELARLPIRRQNIAVGTLKAERKIDASLLGRLLSIATPTSASGRIASTHTTTFSLTKAFKEVTLDADVTAGIKAFLPQVDWKTDSHYYLIRETIGASAMSYVLQDSTMRELGGRAKLSEAFAGRTDLSWSSSASNDLVQRFPMPYRVLYKIEEITRPAGTIGGMGTVFRLVPPENPVRVEAMCDSAGQCR